MAVLSPPPLSLLLSFPLPLSLTSAHRDTSIAPRDRDDGGSEARPLPPKGSLPFGRGGGAVPPPLPVSFFSDDPVEVRLEIERDGVA
jgi:hypothetical protein